MGVRAVYASSFEPVIQGLHFELQGQTPHNTPESLPCKPQSAYGPSRKNMGLTNIHRCPVLLGLNV